MELDGVMVRQCRDDFEAVQIANALQGLWGVVDVMSIVFQPMPIGYDRWHVFIKYDSSLHSPAEINKEISEVLNESATA